MKKLLIVTNHLESFGGSEILALEVAEFFINEGWRVDLYTLIFGDPICQEEILSKVKVLVLGKDTPPDLFEYDIVWNQHHLLPLLVHKYIDNYNFKTFFIFAHLSPYHPLESRGLFVEQLISNVTIVNSEETKESMLNLGIPVNRILNMKNAAPKKFAQTSNNLNNELKNILVISNHVPEELNQAIEHLIAMGINVVVYGLGANQKRIKPKHFQNIDAVITIGKSVQYALLSGIPVFNYDHFGGSGWITMDNYKILEKYNYSGRDSNLKLSSLEIVEELLSGYVDVAKHVLNLQKYAINTYNLDDFLLNIVKKYENINTTPIGNITDNDKKNIAAESCLSQLIADGNYALLREIPKFKNEVEHLSRDILQLNNSIAYLKNDITHLNDELRDREIELNHLYNSKRYRFISKMINLIKFWK